MVGKNSGFDCAGEGEVPEPIKISLEETEVKHLWATGANQEAQ